MNQQIESERYHRLMGGPDWRWRQAEDLVESGQRLRDGVDPLVRTFVAYKRMLLAASGKSEEARQRFPILAAAADLHDAQELLDSLKIMVVAGCERAIIASRLELPLEVVDAFEKLFFDVRPKLDAVDWVSAQVIGPLIKDGAGWLASRLKAAYAGGPGVALMLLDSDARLPIDKGASLFDRKLALALKVDQALAMPISSGRDADRLIVNCAKLGISERRLILDRERFQFQCAEAIKAREFNEKKYQEAMERARLREEERRRRHAERRERQTMRQGAALSRQDPQVILAARQQEHLAARARAQASPLSRLCWKTTASKATVSHESEKSRSVIPKKMIQSMPSHEWAAIDEDAQVQEPSMLVMAAN